MKNINHMSKYTIRKGKKHNHIVWTGLISTFILFLLISCDNSSTKTAVNRIIDGKKNGIHISESSNGILFISFYKDDKLNGVGIEIDKSNGMPITLATYKDNNYQGSNYLFYPSGKIRGIREWEKGRKTKVGIDLFESQKTKSYKEYNEEGYVIYQRDYDSIGKVINEIDKR